MASTFRHLIAWTRRQLGYWNDDRRLERDAEAEQAAIAFEEKEDPGDPD